MSYIVETKALANAYHGQRAVDNLALQVEEGALYGLLGPNGAGKTTTLKLLLGLLRPTEGEILLFGQPWQRAALWQIGALIETPALYGHLTGRENLEVHRRLLGLPQSRIDQVLAQVDLQAAGAKRVAAYSLGMRQRLGISLALLSEPRLLILDEPTNGLDPVGIREIRELLRAFQAQGITVIISSHILAEVAQVASHVGVLSAGQLRYQGQLCDLLSQGQSYLKIETPQALPALALLREHYPAARPEGRRVVVPIPESEAAGALALLAQHGLAVTGIAYQHADLEDLFLRLTGNGGVAAEPNAVPITGRNRG